MATSTKRQHVDVVNTTDENYDPNPGVIIFLNTNAILDQIIRLPGSPITIPAPGPQAATNAFSEWITNQLGSVSASLQENLIEEIGLFPIVSIKIKLELYKLYLLLTSIIKLTHYTQWTCMSVIPYHKFSLQL